HCPSVVSLHRRAFLSSLANNPMRVTAVGQAFAVNDRHCALFGNLGCHRSSSSLAISGCSGARRTEADGFATCRTTLGLRGGYHFSKCRNTALRSAVPRKARVCCSIAVAHLLTAHEHSFGKYL